MSLRKHVLKHFHMCCGLGGGQIKLPITRLETSQKSARGIHIADLAQYLDQQREAARKECAQLNKTLRAG